MHRYRSAALAGVLISTLLVWPANAGHEWRPGPTADETNELHEIRRFHTAEHGVGTPDGLAWDPRRGALVLAESAAAGTRVVPVRPDETTLRTRRSAGPTDADTLAVDPSDGSVVSARSGQVAELGLTSPTAMAFDAADALVVLDSGELIRRGPRGEVTRSAIDGADALDLRGLAAHPDTGLLYTYDAGNDELLALDSDGSVVDTLDTSSLQLSDVQGVAVAPSADTTDDASVQSLYLADAGEGDTSGEIVETSLEPMAVVAMDTVTGELVRTTETSSYDPPSPDTAGITYMPGPDRLFMSDSEVNEMSIFEGSNFFRATRSGELDDTGDSLPWSEEPTGVGYDPDEDRLFVSDDDQKEVFEVTPGSDGRFGTSDDTVTNLDTSTFGNTDPEGVDYDTATDSIWIVDGVNREVFRLQAGSDAQFGTSDDVQSNFDVAVYGAADPEGIGYDPVRDTIVVVDDGSDTIYELDKDGALLNTIDASSVGWRAAAGLTVAPSSTGSGRNYFVVARGQDNDSNPDENDGRLYEISADLQPLPGGGNQAPVVDAGEDQSVILPDSAVLDGTVSDDGQPNPPGTVTTTWSEVSGPGEVTFGDTAAVDTTASFSAPGTYVLRLSAYDGAATSVDDMTVLVHEEGAASTIEKQIAASSDDAEQALSGFMGLNSSDLELGADGSTLQIVGTRFTGLQIPQGSTIDNAYLQFRTDEVSTEATSLTIRAEASDDAATYEAVSGSMAARPTTSVSVGWEPVAWNTVGDVGTGQRTPNIAEVVQAVVDRPGWASGNALAIQIDGSGRRTAESYDGGPTFAPILHVEFTVDDGGTPTNTAPVVDAGPDATVALPDSASLDGTVTDDGLPETGTSMTEWSMVSGAGTVTFADTAAVDTTASFSTDGTYVLRLTAYDGELSASDDVTITVQPESTGGDTRTLSVPVQVGGDDAEERNNGDVLLSSYDLDITADGSQFMNAVGVRLAGVEVPQGAEVTSAYVQFTADEAGSGATAYTVRAQSADNAAPFQATAGDLSSRSTTTASAAWAPAAWNTVGEAGADQRTSDLSAVVQEVVDRPGWAQGSAMVLLFTGTGDRTARSRENSTGAPVLHLEYTTGGSSTPANQAPVVDAGPDATITLPDTASLDGTVADDGLPEPPTLTTDWSTISGPGTVTFTDPAAVDTTASFSTDGTYVLRLTADDGELNATDDVTITVQPQDTTPQVLSTPIRTGAGDGVERFNGSTQLTHADLTLTDDHPQPVQAVGLRFTDLGIPAGAEIVSAHVQFRAQSSTSGTTNLTIRAEAADNAPAFVQGAGSLTSRPTTTASANWQPPEWTAGEAGAAQRTSDLSTVLQEVMRRPGWAQGNAVVLIVTGSGNRVADAFEGGQAPVLNLEWRLS